MHKIIFLISSLMFITLTIPLIFLTTMVPIAEKSATLKEPYFKQPIPTQSNTWFLANSLPKILGKKKRKKDIDHKQLLIDFLENLDNNMNLLFEHVLDLHKGFENEELIIADNYFIKKNSEESPDIPDLRRNFFEKLKSYYQLEENSYVFKKELIDKNEEKLKNLFEEYSTYIDNTNSGHLQDKIKILEKSIYAIKIWKKLQNIWSDFKIMEKRMHFFPVTRKFEVEHEINKTLPDSLSFAELKVQFLLMEKMTHVRNSILERFYDNVSNELREVGYGMYNFSEELDSFIDLETTNQVFFLEWIISQNLETLKKWEEHDFTNFKNVKDTYTLEPTTSILITNYEDLPNRIKLKLNSPGFNMETNNIDHDKLEINNGYLTIYYKEANDNGIFVRMKYNLISMQNRMSWSYYFWEVSIKNTEDESWSKWKGTKIIGGDTVKWGPWSDRVSEGTEFFVASTSVPTPTPPADPDR